METNATPGALGCNEGLGGGAEPVAWISPEYFTAFSRQGFTVATHKIAPTLVPLYAAPQPAERVPLKPLTEAQLDSLIAYNRAGLRALVRLVEQAHGIKPLNARDHRP